MKISENLNFTVDYHRKNSKKKSSLKLITFDEHADFCRLFGYDEEQIAGEYEKYLLQFRYMNMTRKEKKAYVEQIHS